MRTTKKVKKTKRSEPIVPKSIAKKVLEVVDAGLSCGLGEAVPGKMCVEAAVCYAYGLPHSDEPPCVDPAVRSFKISLNDSAWSSNKARAKGMRRIAIAQLGSAGKIDANKFAAILAELTIRKIVPIALRAAAKLNKAFAERLEAAAVRCEKEGTQDASDAARSAASDAASAASDAARSAASYAASDAASDAASAASYAARSAASAASYAASDAASDAASAASYAASDAARSAASDAASAASDAASAASDAASAASYAAKNKILGLAADLGVEALKAVASPGCKWLGLCN